MWLKLVVKRGLCALHVNRFRIERYEHNLDRKRVHAENENGFAYASMLRNIAYRESIVEPFAARVTRVEPSDAVQRYFNDCEFRKRSLTDNVTFLEQLEPFAIDLQEPVYDPFVDYLMDECPNLSDQDLYRMMTTLNWLETKNSTNYTDIWSCLDDICVWRLKSWSNDRILKTLALWYQLRLSRLVDYSFKAVRQLAQRPRALTQPHLIETMFFMNILRFEVNIFDCEYELVKFANAMTLDEFAIVAMAFFKTESHLKSRAVLETMLDRAIDEFSHANEIAITSIAKAVRLTGYMKVDERVRQFQERAIDRLDSLSTIALVHVLLMGVPINVINERFLWLAVDRLSKCAAQLRLKDMERLTFVLSLFGTMGEQQSRLFDAMVEELTRADRTDEIEKFPRVFLNLLANLVTFDYYPESLLRRISTSELLVKAYGPKANYYGREVVVLHSSLEIERPVLRQLLTLSETTRYRLAKIYTVWKPLGSESNYIHSLFANIEQTVSDLTGGPQFYRVEHILPHCPHVMLVFAVDKRTRAFVANVHEHFDPRYKLGDIMSQPATGSLKWFAIIMGSRNNYLRGTNRELGPLQMKRRQLKAIGYEPIVTNFIDWVQERPHEAVDEFRESRLAWLRDCVNEKMSC